MNILTIDTTSNNFSASIMYNNKIFSEIIEHRQHSAIILKTIESLFKESGACYNDIDALGVNTGPGSFTGIRIGLCTMESFSKCLNIPLIGIDSLELLLNSSHSQYKCSFIDARNNKIYSTIKNNNEFIVKPGIYNIEYIAEYCNKYNADIIGNFKNCEKYFKTNRIERSVNSSDICKFITELKEEDIKFNKIEPYYLKMSEPEEKLKCVKKI